MSRSVRLPERVLTDSDLAIRRWRVNDAPALATAIEDSLDELRKWLPWVAMEPLTLAQRRALISEWEHDWEEGGSVLLGAFVGDTVVGASGMHRRIGPGGIEFGYWVRSGFTGQGLATRIAAAVTAAAFRLPDLDHVEIHHDRANTASERIPAKLGFALVAEVPRKPVAPSDSGTQCVWRMTRQLWQQRYSDAAPTTSHSSPAAGAEEQLTKPVAPGAKK